jgi:16S rRNA (adenine1518-N6/adenine1519-N6)-dimethyltransferase
MPGFEDPRRFLSRHALRPKDSFGQCFLVAEPIAEAIVEALGAKPDETVIEIGTGCGTLARMIAPAARSVLAIERDRDLVAALQREPIAPNVELVEADAAGFDYRAVTTRGPTSIVGNLPYQITGKLMRAILAPPIRWRVAVVMVQKEVAARLLAAPGDDDWGVLGVFTRAACETERIVEASPRCFHPAPRVTSTVVRLVPRSVPLAEETEWFQSVVHALFAARRKTIQNGLASVPGVGRDRAGRACETAKLDPRRRPETLSVEELNALADAARLELHR